MKKEQKEFDEAMKEYHELLAEEQTECDRVNNRILKVLRKRKTKAWIKELLTEAEESEVYGKWQIVRFPKGQKQEDNELNEIKHIWVNQTTNGGYTGDEFAGSIYIKLKKDRYLKMDYSM